MYSLIGYNRHINIEQCAKISTLSDMTMPYVLHMSKCGCVFIITIKKYLYSARSITNFSRVLYNL